VKRLIGSVTALAFVALLAASPLARADTTPVCDETTVTMSDGVRLYGVVSRTVPNPPQPVFFDLSPYGTGSGGDPPSTDADPCASLNDRVLDRFLDPSHRDRYNIVFFHMRGSGASEGLWDMLGPRTQADVGELLDWVAEQPWSDGRVVLVGNSGSALYEVYGMHHPAVKAAAVMSTCSEMYRGCTRQGGGLMEIGDGFLGLVKDAYASYAQTRIRLGLDTNPTPPEQLAALEQADADIATHDLFDDWHQARSSHRLLTTVNIPVLYSTDLYDIIPTSLYDAYLLTPGARLLLMGGHGASNALQAVDNVAVQRWVDHYMLGVDNGAESDPRVMMATNLGSRAGYADGNVVLRGESSWPLPATRWERLFLGPGPTGSATSLNDSSLSLDPPDAGGTDSEAVSPESGPKTDMRIQTWILKSRPAGGNTPGIREYSDLRSDEANALTYTTPPLGQNLEITGPIVLRLFASSTVSNFDWVVRLTDVWPDGSSNWITGGLLRASLRRIDQDRSLKNRAGDIVYPYYPFDRHEAVPTGQVVEYQIAVDPTSNVFQAGHRLRLDIIGTGAAALDAANAPGAGPGQVTIYRDTNHPSSLLVPVIPARCEYSVPLLPTTPTLDPCVVLGVTGHIRPKGASPLRASLVPAYQPCASPNEQHGPPLDFGSCNPPTPTSGFLTVGTPDANRAPSNAIGSVRYGVQLNPSPTPNDALIDVSTTDVRCKSSASTTCGNANAAAGSDYIGQLQATTARRITDKDYEPGDSATMQDVGFPVTVPCSGTASTSVGSTCAISTSANSVVPGSVKTGVRAVWEMGQIEVYDGGSSGTAGAGDATLFEHQGIFVP
jgi:putative CocE/NonD family hydrolase